MPLPQSTSSHLAEGRSGGNTTGFMLVYESGNKFPFNAFNCTNGRPPKYPDFGYRTALLVALIDIPQPQPSLLLAGNLRSGQGWPSGRLRPGHGRGCRRRCCICRTRPISGTLPSPLTAMAHSYSSIERTLPATTRRCRAAGGGRGSASPRPSRRHCVPRTRTSTLTRSTTTCSGTRSSLISRQMLADCFLGRLRTASGNLRAEVVFCGVG